MKISLNVIPECPIEEIVQIAKHAEKLGYQRCWVYDEGLATRDVHIVAAAIALETNHMEIAQESQTLTLVILPKLPQR